MTDSIQRVPFQSRGLSNRTVDALLNKGIDAPEHLLFMRMGALRCLPGIGLKAMDENYHDRSIKQSAPAS
jgi:hypothetical protein